jgi:DNA-binding CsgD family transcriptional regulator
MTRVCHRGAVPCGLPGVRVVFMPQHPTTAGLVTIPRIWYPGGVNGRATVLDRVERATRRGPDLVTLWRDVGRLLGEVVPHAYAPCFFTVDPTSLLVTSHFQEGLPEIPAAWLGREYAAPDHNSMTEVLVSPRGVGTLHEATGGHPERSRKYREEMQPFGVDQELLVALRTRDGEPWGVMGLYREAGAPLFDDTDVALLRTLAPMLAEATRSALLTGQACEPDLPDAPGLLVLDDRLAVESLTPTAASWLEALGGSAGSPPASVLAAAGQALTTAGAPVLSRAPSDGAGWVALHASALDPAAGADAGPAVGRRISVILQAAGSGHLASLLMAAHGLTARERDVAGLVLRGATTASAAQALAISEHTVQQHLKSVFDKTGVRSRRELVSVVFHRHYEPRVRDNERRAVAGRAARGGPMAGAS